MPYPVELTAPDISAYARGNAGIGYVHTFDSGAPGPHACVNAVMHGNEICGAIAVHRFLEAGLRPARGRLTFAFVNVGAFLRFDPRAPDDSRFVDEDMNRVWEVDRLDGDERSAELERARLLRPLFDDVDCLLDIHSMGTLSEPILLCNGLDKERDLARRMRYPRTVACGSGHVVGRRLIEYAPFHDTGNDRTALLIECGQHWDAASAVVAVDTALYFLDALEMLPGGLDEAGVTCREPAPQWMLDVTDGYAAKSDDFRFVGPFVGLEEFERAGTLVAIDGGDEVRTPYDGCVLVMPNHRAEKGKRVLRFARRRAD